MKMFFSLLVTCVFCGFVAALDTNIDPNPELRLDLTGSQEKNIGLLSSLYQEYKKAVDTEDFRPPERRVFLKNKAYQIHIQKLKEVDGLKGHNLQIKRSLLRNGATKLLYIINPVEAKTPNSYLTLDEFRDVLLQRAQKDREMPVKETEIVTISRKGNANDRRTRRKSKYVFQTEKYELNSTLKIPTRTSTNASPKTSKMLSSIKQRTKLGAKRISNFNAVINTTKILKSSSNNNSLKYAKLKETHKSKTAVLTKEAALLNTKYRKVKKASIISTTTKHMITDNMATTTNNLTDDVPNNVTPKKVSSINKRKQTNNEFIIEETTTETTTALNEKDVTTLEKNKETGDSFATDMYTNTETPANNATETTTEEANEAGDITEESMEKEITTVITSSTSTRRTYGVTKDLN